MRYLASTVVVFVLGGCASSRGAPAEPAAKTTQDRKTAPRRPIRPIGGQRSPGQVELEAAIAAAKAGDLETGLAKSRAAIEKNPNLEHAYLLAGSICAMQGNIDCEREAYDDGLAALPKSADLFQARGLLHLQLGEYEDAIAKYEEANRLTGNESPTVLADLAYAYVYVGRLDEAKALADEAVGLDDACFECYMALGQVNLSAQDFQAAVAAFAKARQLRPDDPDAGRSEAKSRFLAGEVDAAHTLYEGLVEKNPEDGRLRVQAAQVAMKAEKYDVAVAHLEVVVQANPDQKRLLELLARAQERAGDLRGAKATMEKASQLK